MSSSSLRHIPLCDCKKVKTFLFATDCSVDIAIGFDISRRNGAAGEKLISGQLQTSLPEIVHYLSSIQGLCCTGPTPVQTSIAFQVVDRAGRPLYDTNFESYSKEPVEKVMKLQMSEPTYFNTALLKSSKERFKKSRAGAKVRAEQPFIYPSCSCSVCPVATDYVPADDKHSHNHVYHVSMPKFAS